MAKVDARRAEFFEHLWDHAADEFQVSFDQRLPLSDSELTAVESIVALIRAGKTVPEISAAMKTLILSRDHDLLAVLLQLAGLTRNKILSDLRASAEVKRLGLRVPSIYSGLPRSGTWQLAGDYLATRLVTVFGPVAALNCGIRGAIEAVNQATFPGFVRQERAKRQGHEAEARLASLLATCDLPFEPREKAVNPLCRDATVAGISFDIVIPSVAKPRICFKATVHTANIGQYGESKDDLEVREAIHNLGQHFGQARPMVFALIDGVGFNSNRAGLDGVLETADEFCQFRTLWKAVVAAAGALGNTKLRLELPAAELSAYGDFLNRYKFSSRTFTAPARFDGRRVPAGDGSILIPH